MDTIKRKLFTRKDLEAMVDLLKIMIDKDDTYFIRMHSFKPGPIISCYINAFKSTVDNNAVNISMDATIEATRFDKNYKVEYKYKFFKEVVNNDFNQALIDIYKDIIEWTKKDEIKEIMKHRGSIVELVLDEE